MPPSHVTAHLATVLSSPVPQDVLSVSTAVTVIATMVALAATSQLRGIHYVHVMYHTMANSVSTFAVHATLMAPEAAVMRVVTVKMDGKEDSVKPSAAFVGTEELANLGYNTLAVTVHSVLLDITVKYTMDVQQSLVQMVAHV